MRYSLYGLALAVSLGIGLDKARRRAPAGGEQANDAVVYQAAGRLVLAGRDPNEALSAGGLPYLYPPLLAVLVAPFSRVGEVNFAAGWAVLTVLAGFGCFYELRRLTRLTGGAPAPWPLAGAALLFAVWPVGSTIRWGQIGTILLYLLLVGYRLVRAGSRRDVVLGGALLAIAAALKLTPLLPAAVAVAQPALGGDARRAALAATGLTIGLALGLFVVPAAAVGWSANLSYLARWSQRVAAEETIDPRHRRSAHLAGNQSLANGLNRLRGRDAAGARTPLNLTVSLALLALAVAAWAASTRRGDATASAAGWSLACAVTCLVTPIAWTHHYVLFIPAVLLVPVWLHRRGRPAAALVFATAPWLIFALNEAWLSRYFVLSLGLAVWFVAAAGLLLAAESLQGVDREQPDCL